MPDVEIERLAGDGLEPSTEFVAGLRGRMLAEYHDDVAVVPHSGAAHRDRRPWYFAAAAAVLVVGLVAWIGGTGSPRTTTSPGTTVAPVTTPPATVGSMPLDADRRTATIRFAAPTDAWISSDGRAALYERGGTTYGKGTWYLGSYGEGGLVSEVPVDHVPAAPNHTITLRLTGTGSAVIDDYAYSMVNGVLTRGECFTCGIDQLAPPVVTNGGFDREWKVSYNGHDWRATPPADWDGQPPMAYPIDTGPTTSVAVVAYTKSRRTVVDVFDTVSPSRSRTFSREWIPVNANVDGLLMRLPDPERLDYSVYLLDYPLLPSAVPPAAIGQLWVVTSVHGVPWPTTELPTFTFAPDGSVSGYDGCNTFGPGGSTVRACTGVPDVQSMLHAGPHTLLDDHTLQVGDAVAERFDRPDLEAADLARPWSLGSGVVDLASNGTVSIAAPGCTSPINGTYTLDGHHFALDVLVPACAEGDVTFSGLLDSLKVGGTFWIHEGPELWFHPDGDASGVVRLLPSLNPDVLGPLWVVTSVGGAAVHSSRPPSFRVNEDHTASGFDGCEVYDHATAASSPGAERCPGVQSVMPTNQFSVAADGTLTSGDLVAVPFGTPGLTFAEAARWATWQIGGATLSVATDGTLTLTGPCTVVAHSQEVNGRVTLRDMGAPSCPTPGAATGATNDQLQLIAAFKGGARWALGPASSLWLAVDDHTVWQLDKVDTAP